MFACFFFRSLSISAQPALSLFLIHTRIAAEEANFQHISYLNSMDKHNLGFDFQAFQRQQFVMRWAIISVLHVISFTCSTYQNHDALFSHFISSHFVVYLHFSLSWTFFSSCPLSLSWNHPNRYRCVNTCFTVERNKLEYFNIIMTTWCLEHSICSICHNIQAISRHLLAFYDHIKSNY